ncbi:hypothetical protein ACRALDRAFT_2017880 [Sodiomyces alcalophilus JCM 7366]|uniref:uncharacterized protein n=1 Tax=Sodiomyces alcalophilus JCM 7366 TaxID=591952 RepID=UPI0039B519BC
MAAFHPGLSSEATILELGLKKVETLEKFHSTCADWLHFWERQHKMTCDNRQQMSPGKLGVHTDSSHTFPGRMHEAISSSPPYQPLHPFQPPAYEVTSLFRFLPSGANEPVEVAGFFWANYVYVLPRKTLDIVEEDPSWLLIGLTSPFLISARVPFVFWYIPREGVRTVVASKATFQSFNRFASLRRGRRWANMAELSFTQHYDGGIAYRIPRNLTTVSPKYFVRARLSVIDFLAKPWPKTYLLLLREKAQPWDLGCHCEVASLGSPYFRDVTRPLLDRLGLCLSDCRWLAVNQ